MSRSTLLLYNAKSGKAVTGTFKNGVFTKKHSYQFPTGVTDMAASCDTVVLLDVKTGYGAIGSLENGSFTVTQQVHFTGVTTLAASCDTVLAYASSNGSATRCR